MCSPWGPGDVVDGGCVHGGGGPDGVELISNLSVNFVFL